MPIDPRMVKWDEAPPVDAVEWDSPKADFSGVTVKASSAPRRKSRHTGQYGITPFLVDTLDAAQHHATGLLHGGAQLVQHGIQGATNALIDAPAQTMSGLVSGQAPQATTLPQQFRQYVNQTVAADDAALRQREADYQERTQDNVSSYLGAGLGEVLPWMVGAPAKAVNAVGQGATKVLSRAPRVVQRVGSGAAQGTAVSAVQPVVGEGDYGSQKGIQLAVGAGTGGALPAVAGTLRGIARTAAPFVSPNRVANRQVAQLYGSDPSILNTLDNAPSYLAGEMPTTAQVLATPRAVQVEKALANRPEIKGQLMGRQSASNAARLDTLRGLGGTDEELSAAVKTRRDAARPFRQNSLPEEGSALVDSSGIVAQLKKLEMSADATIRGAAREHLGLIAKQSKAGQTPAFLLDDIRENIGGMLAKHAPQGVVGDKTAAKYGPISAQIIREVDRAVPGYRDYLAAYRANSAPINTMEAARGLLQPVESGALDATGSGVLTLPRLNAGLNKIDKSRYGMTPEARAQVEGLRKSLQRESISGSVKQPGSDTAYNLNSDGWLAGQIFGPNMQGPSGKALGASSLLGAGVGSSLGGPIGAVIGTSLPLALKSAADRVNQRIVTRVGQAAADPKVAAQMIRQFLQQNPGSESALLAEYPQWAALLGAPQRSLLEN